ncbi:MAG: hypothetical protein II889_02800 [Clostridia bacterium]|nr:hypothetical protein [Clostridia bacterium]
MSVDFDESRMAEVLDRHARWWSGTLDGPLMAVTIYGAHPKPGGSKAPALSQASCADFRWSPEELIETLDEELSTLEFAGDAYPRVNFDAFGPGVLAAFCGAKLDNSSGGVWFFPDGEHALADLHPRYDPDNVWARRIKDIYRAGLAKWGKCVVMGMPDLGGVMDVAASLRGTENLLTDLYDDPEEVLRLVGEVEAAWVDAYRDFASVLHPASAGYTDWSGLLSPVPSYIIQCDFCYMIGNGMFRRFVLPTLARDTERLTNTIYHLDGIGELCHLDSILALPELNAVQWVYGAGKPGPMHWLDVYRKIRAAGKRMMVVGGPSEVLGVIDALGGDGVYCNQGVGAGDAETLAKLLAVRK